MAATAAIIGKGTTIGYCATSNGSYTSLTEVRNVSFPSTHIGKVDVTNYESPSSQMEYISAVWRENDDVEVEIAFLNTQSNTLDGLLGTTKYWKVTLPNGTNWIFSGFLSKIGGAIPNKDSVTQTLTISPMGTMTITSGS